MPGADMEPAYRNPVRALVAGLACSTLGPVAGCLATVLSLQRAFGAVALIDPSRKATVLAEGISGAMTWTAVGLGVGIVGVVVTLGATLLLLRAGAAKGRPGSPPAPPTGSAPAGL